MATYRYLWAATPGQSASLAIEDPTGLWLTEPYMPDMASIISAPALTHIVQATLVTPSGERIELDVEDATTTWDESRSPRVEATLTCKVPDDQAILTRIDPRTGARVEIRAGYQRPVDGFSDVHLIADLGLRARPVRRPDDLMTITARSDEALLIDGAPCASGTLTASTTKDAIAAVVRQVLPAGIDSTGLTSNGPAVTQSQIDTDRWDTVQDLADRIDAKVYDNGDRVWRVRNTPVIGTPKHVVKVGENGTITESEAGLDRDTWANWVTLRYVWTDASNVRQRVVANASITSGPYAATSGNLKIFLDERETPTTQAQANAAANSLVKRMVTRGRSFSVSAIAAYWLRPGDTVTVLLPLGGEEDHLVSSVSFNHRSGLMAITTRLPDNTGTIGA